MRDSVRGEAGALLTASRELDREGETHTMAEVTIRAGTKGQHYAGRHRKPRVPQIALWLTLLETGGRLHDHSTTVRVLGNVRP